MQPYDTDFQERGPDHTTGSCFGPDGVYYMGKNSHAMVLAAKNGHPTEISFMITGDYGSGNTAAAWSFQRGPYRAFVGGHGASGSCCAHQMLILNDAQSPDAYYHIDRCHNFDDNCAYLDKLQPGADLLYILWKTNGRGDNCYGNDGSQRSEAFFHTVMDTLGVPRPEDEEVVTCPKIGLTQDQDFIATYSDPERKVGSTANYQCNGGHSGSDPDTNGEMTCQPDGTWQRPGTSRNSYQCCSQCIQSHNAGANTCCQGTCRSSYDSNTVGHSSCQNCPSCNRDC
eukprot:COSAG02_NODE_415_length_22762_cov_133.681816_10_plen_284_part_00